MLGHPFSKADCPPDHVEVVLLHLADAAVQMAVPLPQLVVGLLQLLDLLKKEMVSTGLGRGIPMGLYRYKLDRVALLVSDGPLFDSTYFLTFAQPPLHIIVPF